MPHTFSTYHLLIIALAGIYAGAQNTLAGGGSFITFPALILAGIPPINANISSTIALFPAQITSWFIGRKLTQGVGETPFWLLAIISLLGGIVGAYLLLRTPPTFFVRLVPWLVLFATSVFAWGSFGSKLKEHEKSLPPRLSQTIQFFISIYGGYFGAGIGFLMLAALTLAGQSLKIATATKNALAMLMNLSAMLVFIASGLAVWPAVLALGAGGILGGCLGGWLMHRIPEKQLRLFVVIIGGLLSIWLFIR